MGYSIQVQEAVIKKVLLGNKRQHEIAKEFGVGRSTIGKWLKEYKQKGSIKLSTKEKRPKDWTAEERISSLIETGAMTAEKRTAWCPKKQGGPIIGIDHSDNPAMGGQGPVGQPKRFTSRSW